MKPWKTRSRETILSCGKFLTVERHAVELPDGRIIPDWSWIITPDYVNILPITRSGEFLLFQQMKYAVGEECLGVIGGYIEPYEAPLAAAQRELLEETGYAAETWIPLGNFVVDANRGAGNAHFFLALGAEKVSDTHADDLEEQALVQISRADLETALFDGKFKVLPWVSSVGMALLYLQKINTGSKE